MNLQKLGQGLEVHFPNYTIRRQISKSKNVSHTYRFRDIQFLHLDLQNVGQCHGEEKQYLAVRSQMFIADFLK